MKKDYTQEYIIGGVVLVAAVGGYYLYRGAKKKKEAAAEAEAERKRLEAEQAEVVKKNVKTTPTYSPYQLQVIALQTRLGVGTDGNPGTTANSQTNKKVAEFFPTLYKQYGNVSPANVNIYITAKREEAKQTGNTGGRTNEIWAAMGGGKPAVLRKDGFFTALYYDSSKKVYLPTGGGFTVKAGAKFYKSTSKLTQNGLIAQANGYDKSGKLYTNKLMLITPENLYVP